jgi:hypothetical protein
LLADGMELAGYAELGSGTQRAGVEAARAAVHAAGEQVGGAWRSLVSSPTAHRGPGVGGTGGVEGVWRREWVQHRDARVGAFP